MNIAEILKNCPEGMKLYSPIWGNVEFIKINALNNIEIKDNKQIRYIIYSDGKCSEYGEVILFPSREQYDWNKFQAPFKKGDIIAGYNEAYNCVNIGIFDHYRENDKYCILKGVTDDKGIFRLVDSLYDIGNGWIVEGLKLATDSEVKTLEKAMREVGYLLKDGNIIRIAPKFDIGDTITNGFIRFTITGISDLYYMDDNDVHLSISKQDEYELAKFDLLSLNPYDKVLIKEEEDGCWVPTLISYVTTSEVFTIDKNDSVSYVIPFEPNKHLVGKFDDPDKYYITW